MATPPPLSSVESVDACVNAFFNGSGPGQEKAKKALHIFSQEDPSLLPKIRDILSKTTKSLTHYWCLQILHVQIKKYWLSWSPRARKGIRDMVVKKIRQFEKEFISNSNKIEHSILLKYDVLLIDIAKKTWPKEWSQFIHNLVSNSMNMRRSEVKEDAPALVSSMNTLYILQLLSQDLFEFSEFASSLTSEQVSQLRIQLNKDFQDIFKLLRYVLQTVQHTMKSPGDFSNQYRYVAVRALNQALQSLRSFLGWIPLPHIFQTPLIPLICSFISPSKLDSHTKHSLEFESKALECLSEIAKLSVVGPGYDWKSLTVTMFHQIIQVFERQIPPDHVSNFIRNPQKCEDSQLTYMRRMAEFIIAWLSNNHSLIEKLPPQAGPSSYTPPTRSTKSNEDIVILSHRYLIQFTNACPNSRSQVFRLVLDYWLLFSERLFKESPIIPSKLVETSTSSSTLDELFKSSSSNDATAFNPNDNDTPLQNNDFSVRYPRRDMYHQVITRLMKAMVYLMPAPEECLTETVNGMIVRTKYLSNSAKILYQDCRQTIRYLTRISMGSIREIIIQSIDNFSSSEEGKSRLCSICWALGALAGIFSPNEETEFITNVLKRLLNLCFSHRSKDTKVVVANNIFYVCSKYPRYLKNSWIFLQTVVFKLTEFLRESHTGVQDMAVDILASIARDCGSEFCRIHKDSENSSALWQKRRIPGYRPNKDPFVVYMFEDFRHLTSKLNPHQHQIFFEALGHMVAPARENKSLYIKRYLQETNNSWEQLISRAKSDQSSILAPQPCQQCVHLISLNHRACNALGPAYEQQLKFIFNDLIILNNIFGEQLEKNQSLHPQQRKQYSYVRIAIYQLFGSFAKQYTTRDESALKRVLSGCIVPLLTPTLTQYISSRHISSRDPEFLAMITEFVSRFGLKLGSMLKDIFTKLVAPTLAMIHPGVVQYPELRRQFYFLLHALNIHTMPFLLTLPRDEYNKKILWAVIHGLRHPEYQIAKTAVATIEDMIKAMLSARDITKNTWFQMYTSLFIVEISRVLTDGGHSSHFSLHANLLHLVLGLVRSGHLTMYLNPNPNQSNSAPAATINSSPGGSNDIVSSNTTYLKIYMATKFQKTFRGVSAQTIQTFITKLFEMARPKKIIEFRTVLRDFLISLKTFGPTK